MQDAATKLGLGHRTAAKDVHRPGGVPVWSLRNSPGITASSLADFHLLATWRVSHEGDIWDGNMPRAAEDSTSGALGQCGLQGHFPSKDHS